MSMVLAKPSNVESAVELCERATTYLEQAESLWEVKRIADFASMIRQWLQQQKAADVAKDRATDLMLEAARRGGDLLREFDKLTAKEATDRAKAARKNVGDSDGPIVGPSKTSKKEALAEIGLSKQEAARWEQMASVPDDQYRAYRASGQERSKAGLLRLAAGGKLAAFSSESVEWYTPPEYIEAARKALGGEILLDPASSARANEVVRAKRFFTREDDALSKRWSSGAVWLNPPYADNGETNTGTWVSKMVEEHVSGRMAAGILLVNAVTDRSWFPQLFDYAICFTNHRIKFYTPSGQPQSPISGNAFVYFGAARKRFAAAFSEFGSTVVRA